MESTVRYIERHVESLSAVLILGVPSVFARMEYTFSTWSAIFPKNNVALIYPYPPIIISLDRLFFVTLSHFSIFNLDSPIVPFWAGETLTKSREHRSLKSLVELFDWLDDLEPQPAKEIVSLFEKYQNITAILDQRAQEVEIDRLMTRLKMHSAVSLSHCLHLALETYTRWC